MCWLGSRKAPFWRKWMKILPLFSSQTKSMEKSCFAWQKMSSKGIAIILRALDVAKTSFVPSIFWKPKAVDKSRMNLEWLWLRVQNFRLIDLMGLCKDIIDQGWVYLLLNAKLSSKVLRAFSCKKWQREIATSSSSQQIKVWAQINPSNSQALESLVRWHSDSLKVKTLEWMLFKQDKASP